MVRGKALGRKKTVRDRGGKGLGCHKENASAYIGCWGLFNMVPTPAQASRSSHVIGSMCFPLDPN